MLLGRSGYAPLPRRSPGRAIGLFEEFCHEDGARDDDAGSEESAIAALTHGKMPPIIHKKIEKAENVRKIFDKVEGPQQR